ncbi:MAG: molybdopterin-binding protein [Treponema sp.]
MKEIPLSEAVGHILCHDLTQIIVGVSKDARFRKGHIVTEDDIPVLRSMGKEHLFVWEKTESMLHEDEGAEILAAAAMGANLEKTAPKEGKIELKALIDGMLKIDTERLFHINKLGEVMIATQRNHIPVKKGQAVAGMRVIPLLIAKEKAAQVTAIADSSNPLIAIIPYQIKTCTILVTGNEILTGIIEDTFAPVVQAKLADYGVETLNIIKTGDDVQTITAEIQKAVAAGSEMVLCTGGMSVDPDDKTPAAIRASGAQIVSYGAPVLPGAMMLLAYLGEVPVCGLPGCVMYAKRTVFDRLLPRILAREPITVDDIALLGEGGLCP